MGVRAKWTNVQNRPAQLLITAATIYTMARGSLMQPPNAKAVAGWYILYKSINVHYKLIIARYVLFPQLHSSFSLTFSIGEFLLLFGCSLP